MVDKKILAPVEKDSPTFGEFSTGADSPFWVQGTSRQTSGPVLYELLTSEVAVRLAYVRPDSSEIMLLAAGNGEVGAQELAKISEQFSPPQRTMIERGIYDALPLNLRKFYGPHWGWEWDYYWTNEKLPPSVREIDLKVSPPGSANSSAVHQRIYAALQDSNTTTAAKSEFANFTWFYVETAEGEIAAVVGMDILTGVAELHGLGTRPKFRKQGYGSALMIAATNYCFENAGVKALQFGMWHWNSNARRIYQRLGYQQAGVFLSGRAEPFPDLQKQAR